MSAYAIFPFSSFVSPIVTVSGATNTQCDDDLHEIKNDRIMENNNKNWGPEHKSAVRIKVKSANVDAGILTRPTRRSKGTSSRNVPSPHVSKQPQDCFSLPDDAVLFKLSIRFNGRKYTATRSFAKFVKLRRDLGRELNEAYINVKTRSKEYKRGAPSHQYQSCNVDDAMKQQSRCIEAEPTLPQLPESISDQADGNCHFALPTMSSGISMAMAAASVPFSMSSRGFTKLQSLLLCYYCPLIECWLKSVIDMIDFDTSPCFNNFMWEPLRDDESNNIPSSLSSSTHSSTSIEHQKNGLKKKHSLGSALSLCSIHEDLGGFETNCDD